MNFYKIVVLRLTTKNDHTKAVLNDVISQINNDINDLQSQITAAMDEYKEKGYTNLLLKIQDLTDSIKELGKQKEFFEDQLFHLFEKE